MKNFNFKSRLKSFQYAGQGFTTFLRTQPNAWIHALATFVALSLSAYFSITRIEWLFILIAIGLVWMAELFNTAIEFLADEVSQEKRDRIGKAKDIAACGVLGASILAFLIGVFVFNPYLLRFFV